MDGQKRKMSARRDGGILWLLFIIALLTLFISKKYGLGERVIFIGLFFLFWYIYIVVCFLFFRATIGMATTRTHLRSSISNTLTLKQTVCYGLVYYIRVLSSFARRPGRYEPSETDFAAEQKWEVTWEEE